MSLSISIVQTNLFWEDVTANLAMLEEKIANFSEPSDLIVMPEMFNTGFSMQPQKVAETMNSLTHKWLKMMAKKTGAVMVGSLAIKENGAYYNRLLWVGPDGQTDSYDKRHLFRMGGEHEVYAAGQMKIVKDLKGFKICPFICYDLRFPVWSRNVDLSYDIFLNIANWPAVRRNVWNTLLQARALENQCYVVGANRIGEDANGLAHSGDSMFIDFKGEIISTAKAEDTIIQHTFEKEPLGQFRAKFPAYLDADEFELKR